MQDNNHLSSTRRLPRLGRYQKCGKEFVCLTCGNTLSLSPEWQVGHMRCRYCGSLHRVGIPDEYVRIVCDCGKVLTAAKKNAGRSGRCPGCRKRWEVPGAKIIVCHCRQPLRIYERYIGKQGKCPSCGVTIEIAEALARKTGQHPALPLSPSSEKYQKRPDELVIGPTHFQCPCGQAHVVEGDCAGVIIRCFRCGNDLIAPIATPDNGQQLVAALAHSATSAGSWYIETAYPRQDLLALLEVSPDSSPAEIKDNYRRRQKQINRRDPRFQQLQLAKDTLARPAARMRYELLSPQLVLWWHKLTRSKWLKLHDRAIGLHQKAIDYEKSGRYRQADRAWQKALTIWLRLIQKEPLWQAALARGQKLFAHKCSPEVIAAIRDSFIEEVLLPVNLQFHDRYLAENNLSRAHAQLQALSPLLFFLQRTRPTASHIEELLVAYLIEECQKLAEQQKWKKAARLVLRMADSFPGNPGASAFIANFFSLIKPFLAAGDKAKFTAHLGWL